MLDLCCGSGDIALLAAEKVGPTGQVPLKNWSTWMEQDYVPSLICDASWRLEQVVGLDFAPEQLSVAARRQNGSFKASQVHME